MLRLGASPRLPGKTGSVGSDGDRNTLRGLEEEKAGSIRYWTKGIAVRHAAQSRMDFDTGLGGSTCTSGPGRMSDSNSLSIACLKRPQ